MKVPTLQEFIHVFVLTDETLHGVTVSDLALQLGGTTHNSLTPG